LIEIGGELKARGQGPRGGPWRVGIERPVPGEIALQRIVRLERGALATSGDYRHFYEKDGRRYSHLIDPRTGAPVTHDLASVSVIAGSTMAADALSTALMVLGPGPGLRLARRHRLAALFIVRRDGGLIEFSTPAFDRHVVV
jgi:thiamine biosynthesis lipoprotein